VKPPKIKELKEAIKAVFMKRYTNKFLVLCEAAEGFRGMPVPNDSCSGCEACSEICPSQAIVIEDNADKKVRIIRRYYDRCNYCGQCELLCHQAKPGVVLTREYDMADHSRSGMQHTQEFKIIACDKCGKVLGTKKQLLETSDRVGPALASANPNLILLRQKVIGYEMPSTIKLRGIARSDILVFLCPACRHKVYEAEIDK